MYRGSFWQLLLLCLYRYILSCYMGCVFFGQFFRLQCDFIDVDGVIMMLSNVICTICIGFICQYNRYETDLMKIYCMWVNMYADRECIIIYWLEKILQNCFNPNNNGLSKNVARKSIYIYMALSANNFNVRNIKALCLNICI